MVVEVEGVRVFVVGGDEDRSGMGKGAEGFDELGTDAAALVGGENGDVEEEDFFDGDSGERNGVGREAAEDLVVFEGGESPEGIVFEEALDVTGRQSFAGFFKNRGHKREELGGCRRILGCEAADLHG